MRGAMGEKTDARLVALVDKEAPFLAFTADKNKVLCTLKDADNLRTVVPKHLAGAVWTRPLKFDSLQPSKKVPPQPRQSFQFNFLTDISVVYPVISRTLTCSSPC
jgi:hypothetical protein